MIRGQFSPLYNQQALFLQCIVLQSVHIKPDCPIPEKYSVIINDLPKNIDNYFFLTYIHLTLIINLYSCLEYIFQRLLIEKSSKKEVEYHGKYHLNTSSFY